MKILYGLPSEGMGHATRSKVLITHLLQQHDVQIVTSDKAYSFLQQHFGNRVHEIGGFHLAFKNHEVSIAKTIWKTIKDAPSNIKKSFEKYTLLLQHFKPDVCITDFDSFTHLYAALHKIPLMSIDNMHVLSRCTLDITIPTHEKNNYLLAKNIIGAKIAGANNYLISSFFEPPITKKNTCYIPPIIRPEIIAQKPSYKKHIVVYQTAAVEKTLIETLTQIPNEQFIVYGFNKEKEVENVTLKKFSEKEFIQYFASAKAVIAHGGFSFISEAVYMQKPILSVPIPNQFEQYVNAAYVQKLQYGKHVNELTPDVLKSFLYDVPIYQTTLKKYKQKGNEETCTIVDKILSFYK